jgi:hypothetical protein
MNKINDPSAQYLNKFLSDVNEHEYNEINNQRIKKEEMDKLTKEYGEWFIISNKLLFPVPPVSCFDHVYGKWNTNQQYNDDKYFKPSQYKYVVPENLTAYQKCFAVQNFIAQHKLESSLTFRCEQSVEYWNLKLVRLYNYSANHYQINII